MGPGGGWYFIKREAQITASELFILRGGTEVLEERGTWRVRGRDGIGTQIYFPTTKPGALVLLIKMDPMYHFKQYLNTLSSQGMALGSAIPKF